MHVPDANVFCFEFKVPDAVIQLVAVSNSGKKIKDVTKSLKKMKQETNRNLRTHLDEFNT